MFEISANIPKRLLQKTENTEQVDIAKKILEDPLYAIRQKELEARKQLLNNPVKLKQIKQMVCITKIIVFFKMFQVLRDMPR